MDLNNPLTDHERLNVALLTRLFGYRQDADNPRGFTAPDGRYVLLDDLPDYAGGDDASLLVTDAMRRRGWAVTASTREGLSIVTLSHADRRLGVGRVAASLAMSAALGALAALDYEDAGHGAAAVAPLAVVDMHGGRWCLRVAGLVLAVEGDPCRDTFTDDRHWRKESLEEAAARINATARRRR